MSGGSAGESKELGKSNIPTRDVIEAQLARILRSERFAKSERLAAFLTFVVRQSLTCSPDQLVEELKEYNIGLVVFGRDGDFDPATNAIVRTTATRLRKELARYNENEGDADSVVIELPTGHYIPQFRIRPNGNGGPPQKTEPNEMRGPARQFGRLEKGIAAGLLVSAASIGLWWVETGRHPVSTSTNDEISARRIVSRATTEGHAPLRIVTGEPEDQLLITPDGNKLYAIPPPGGRMISVIGAKDMQRKKVITLPLPPATAFMSRSGRRLYLSAYTPEQGVMVVDMQRDAVIEVISTRTPVFGLVATPDEKKLFLALGYSGVESLDLQTRERHILSPVPCPLHLSIDDAGKHLYISYQCGGPGGRPGHDSTVIYDVNSERSTGLIRDLPTAGAQPVVSPQGNLLLLDGGDACSSPDYDHLGCPAIQSRILHLWSLSEQRLVASIPAQIAGTGTFVPHSSRIALAGANLAVWDWARQVVLENVSLPGERFSKIAFTPEGDRAFVTTESGELFVFDAEKDECVNPAAGLANFYAGDGTFDDSQSGATLVSSSPPQFAPGRMGQSFRFDGADNFLETEAGSAFCPFCGQDWTESLFVKFESKLGEMTILQRVATDLTPPRRLYKAQNNRLVLQQGSRMESTMIHSIDPVETNRWYHVAVVTEGERLSLYIDGILQGSGSKNQPFKGGDRAPIFLAASEGKRDFLKGLLDEVAVYNRALSRPELIRMALSCRFDD